MIVNLMASDVWSESDISLRVQVIIRYEVTAEDELKAARLSRKPSKSLEDSVFISFVDAVITDAIEQGRQARADMDLLTQVLLLEKVTRRLDMPVIDPILDDHGLVINQAIIAYDLIERSNAEALIDAGTTEAWSLFDTRNPLVIEPTV